MGKKLRDWKADVDAIRRILNREWDPIGCGVPEDEYDSYIPTIYRMMQQQASVNDLVWHLNKLVTTSMGLRSQPEKDRRTAELLVELIR